MLDHDIFTHNANSNRKRIFALSSWTVMFRVRGWYIRKTDTDSKWRGPFSSETSASLMIARELKRELLRRDGMPS
jgi:hypothetical protein